ncbi:MAG: DUF4976 domain-containing protein, partial [Planctomycetota bacterium]|nr:DUF4976 domain-containing protein [Planctomycetota bacterium]
GTKTDAVINNVDFAPTLIDLAGGEPLDIMQGNSFRSLLEGKPAPEDWKQSTYYRYWMHMAHHDNPAHLGIRTHDFKLICFYGQPLDAKGALPETTPTHWELYDLQKDPHEMNNVVEQSEYADMLTQLRKQLIELQSQVGDTMPEIAAR